MRRRLGDEALEMADRLAPLAERSIALREVQKKFGSRPKPVALIECYDRFVQTARTKLLFAEMGKEPLWMPRVWGA